ncbi:C39 family peptidase [Lysinibacillus odysseyi]|uniref:Peptidase C39-like domain-containing protein n=1 Tax=Lysinibacillus odysseyi 34hs-1 = NBRC 100172 TaxID=1220589 RepID=A0A0A3IQ50_9BACI|nr:C39 family peptidase [Lysinibacillus odysseyi]KGR84998.1 hypothetical protein CD32_11115 [Lysinibacillus odysseyi 34hs-1 = NBRC 100172]
MKWRLTLTCSLSLLLLACHGNDTQGKTEGAGLVVMPVEYYSGAAVSNVMVEVYDEAGEQIGSEISYEGEAVFPNVQSDKTYLIRIGPEQYIEDDTWGTQKTIVFDASSPQVVIETNAVDHEQALAVPVQMQKPELPHGCEITSLTSVLAYYGAETDKVTMSSKYLPKQAFKQEGSRKIGPNPNEYYAGEPSSPKGTYSFAGPIVQAANDYIDEHEMNLIAENKSGSSVEEIEQYIKLGVPVISWVTLDLSEPRKKGGWYIAGTNTFHEMYTNLHAVVIVDITDKSVEVMDPLKGIVQLDKKQFFASYKALGEQAVVVY